jgi:hypothetical protein
LKGFKRFSALLSVIFIAQFVLGQSSGFKYFKNYSYKEYEHQPQNWQVLQAPNGMIYVANNGGVLEYDGTQWRTIYKQGITIRSIGIDQSATIFAGGRKCIFYLAPDPKGTLKLVSLKAHLDKKY